MTSPDKDLRPYKNPSEFAMLYDISYGPEGVIDHHSGKPISMSLPTTLQYNNQQRSSHGIGITKLGLKAPIKKASVSTDKLIGSKDIYSDLEFQEYFDFNNLKELFNNLIRSFIRNYFKVVISEPFEVTRFFLQVGSFNIETTKTKPSNDTNEFNDDEDEEDDEDINFFSSAESTTLSPVKTRTRRKSNIERSVPSIRMASLKDDPKVRKHHVKPVSLKTLDIMSSLLSKEGSRGLWRGINTTFIYQTLSTTLELWITGFLSPVLNIPDPFFIDIIHSSNPFKSLCLSITAGVLTLILLQPIDLIRLKFVATSTTLTDKRSFQKIIMSYSWKDFIIPVNLIVPTLNYSLVTLLWKKCTPYLLHTKFNIDKYSAPLLYWTITLVLSVSDLFLKLPLELLLRRAQLDYLLDKEECTNEELRISPDELSFEFGGYFGYLTTLYYVYQGTVPGYAIDKYLTQLPNVNKGIEAIFRGWRVGLLNVIGNWGLDLMNETSQANFQDEKF